MLPLKFYFIGVIGLIFASLTITYGMGLGDFTGGLVGVSGGFSSLFYIPIILILISITIVVVYFLTVKKKVLRR